MSFFMMSSAHARQEQDAAAVRFNNKENVDGPRRRPQSTTQQGPKRVEREEEHD